jgi:hypothetical protein
MVLDAAVGDRLLADLGFLHVPGPPNDSAPAYLFVAIRKSPTLRHFDPERIDYWTTEDGCGLPASLDGSARPGQAAFSWGVIRVVDRKSVTNEFASFGGSLEVRRFDDALIATFRSAAPIAALGGHSQWREQGSDGMAAFFGRVRAAIARDSSLRQLVADATPTALYCAFLADTIERHRDQRGEIVGDLAIAQLAMSEAARLRASAAADWHMGAPLASTFP